MAITALALQRTGPARYRDTDRRPDQDRDRGPDRIFCTHACRSGRSIGRSDLQRVVAQDPGKSTRCVCEPGNAVRKARRGTKPREKSELYTYFPGNVRFAERDVARRLPGRSEDEPRQTAGPDSKVRPQPRCF